MKLTIFCSSKENLNNIYYDNANILLNNINNNITIVYGGGQKGIMGCIKKSFKGNIITSNLYKFQDKYDKDDYIYDTISLRQNKLITLGDCYLILPSSYGTHFEALEVITNNDINECNKKIFILNINNIFDDFLIYLKSLYTKNFISRELESLNVIIESDPIKLASIINNFNHI